MLQGWQESKDSKSPKAASDKDAVSGNVKAAPSNKAGAKAPTSPSRDDQRDDDETPLRYGVAAQHQFGAKHPKWNPELEKTLQTDWQADAAKPDAQAKVDGSAQNQDKSNSSQSRRDWSEVQPQVRHGYEHKDGRAQGNAQSDKVK